MILFRKCKFEDFDNFALPEKVAPDIRLDFHRSEFRGLNFERWDLNKVNFSHCKWRKIGKWFGKHIYLCERPKEHDADEVHYRTFRQKFEREQDFYLASQFHIAEMEMQRLWRKADPNKGLGDYIYYIILWLYRGLSAYGNSFTRVLGWLGVAVIAFTVCFLLSVVKGIAPQSVTGKVKLINYDVSFTGEGLKTLISSELWSDVVRVFTFTLSTFYFGRTKHLDPASLLGEVLEVFAFLIGPILTALFILALRRNFRSLKG